MVGSRATWQCSRLTMQNGCAKTAGSPAQPTTPWLLNHPIVTPCLPALQLASNAEILRRTADGPVQAVVLATQEYAKLTGTVLKGEGWCDWLLRVYQALGVAGCPGVCQADWHRAQG